MFTYTTIQTLTITHSTERTTSAILGSSFNWKVSGQNGEVSELIIDASDLSIQAIENKTGKRITFTENAIATTGGEFYDPDGLVPMTGTERAGKAYTYDATEGKWLAIKHTVTFDSTTGSTVPDGRVFDGCTLPEPDNPEKYGYSFDGWFTDSGLTVKYVFQSPVTDDFTLYAKWDPAFTSTIESSAGPGGWIDPDKTGVPYDGVTFHFQANEGYRIKNVKVNGGFVDFDVDQDGMGSYVFRNVEYGEYLIRVDFETFFTVSVNDPDNGIISPDDYEPVEGNDVTVTIVPDEGYRLDILTDNGDDVLTSAVEEDDGTWTYIISQIGADHVVHATFVKIQYEVTVNRSGEGFVYPAADMIVEHGDSVSFTFFAKDGYRISEVSVDGAAVEYEINDDGEGVYVLSHITDNHSFEVSFELNVYDVVLTSGEGYGLVPAEGFSSPVDHRGSFAFVLTLDREYNKSVPVILMNGTVIATTSGSHDVTLMLLNIIEDTEITVEDVVMNVYSVTVSSGDDMSFTYVIDEEEPVEFAAGPGEAYVISVLHGSTLSVKAVPGDGQQFLWDYTCVGTVRGDVLTIDVMNDCTVGGSLQKDYGKFEFPIIIVIAVAIILGYAVFRMREGLG